MPTPLFPHQAAWVESSAWDGRVGVVVGTDIAIYGTPSARPTGGAGAIALAVGPNAPLQLEGGLRASYMAHAYDFFKPELESEYPIVDGHVSNRCFLQALDACFHGYTAKFAAVAGRPFRLEADADYVLFHTPYSKLVQRAFARLVRPALSLRDFELEHGALTLRAARALTHSDLSGRAAAPGPRVLAGSRACAPAGLVARHDARPRRAGQDVSGCQPRFVAPPPPPPLPLPETPRTSPSVFPCAQPQPIVLCWCVCGVDSHRTL